jgi:hypothetical protein
MPAALDSTRSADALQCASRTGTRRRLIAGGSGLMASLALPGGARSQSSAPATSSTAAPQITPRRAVHFDLSCRVDAARLDRMTASAFTLFNQPAILPAFEPLRQGCRNDVDLYRLVAPLSVPETGEVLTISGLLAIPAGVSGPIPVVSWQHGTVLSFDEVPSGLLKLANPSYALSYPADSLETLFNVQRFAGRGYAVIAADYVGKGPFRDGRGEGYAVKGVTVAACLRMLETGLAAMRSLGLSAGPLFLSGWSQGALNTEWLHQALRSLHQPVAGTTVASPFNELFETLRFWTGVSTHPPPAGQSTYPARPGWISLCLIILLGSYELHYGLKGLMQTAVAAPYREFAARFWQSYDMRFDPQRPFPTGDDLLVAGFFDRFTDDRNSAFLRQIAQNTATWWRYDAPIRFHIGLADEALHPTPARRGLAAGGGLASEVAVPGGSHRGNFLASLYGDGATLSGRENAFEWFETLRRGRPT